MEVNLYGQEWPLLLDDPLTSRDYTKLIQKSDYPRGIKTMEGAKAFCDLISKSWDHFRLAALQVTYLRDTR